MLLLYSVYPVHDASDWWGLVFLMRTCLSKFFWPPVSSFYQNFHPFCQFKAMEDSSGVAAAFIHSTFVISPVPCSTCRTSTVGTMRQLCEISAEHQHSQDHVLPVGCSPLCSSKDLFYGKLLCLPANTTPCRGGGAVPQPGER